LDLHLCLEIDWDILKYNSNPFAFSLLNGIPLTLFFTTSNLSLAHSYFLHYIDH